MVNSENKDRERYVLKYCCDFLTPQEKKIVAAAGKLRTQYFHSIKSGRESLVMLAGGNDDKRIEKVLSGDNMPLSQIANRVMKDNHNIIKACPHCNYVLRTPKAKQCRNCYKDWHEKNT